MKPPYAEKNRRRKAVYIKITIPSRMSTKRDELLTSFSALEPVFPSKSSGPLAQPVVSDLFFNIAKYIFHSELSILHYMLW
jgi:hypothetical protein